MSIIECSYKVARKLLSRSCTVYVPSLFTTTCSKLLSFSWHWLPAWSAPVRPPGVLSATLLNLETSTSHQQTCRRQLCSILSKVGPN